MRTHKLSMRRTNCHCGFAGSGFALDPGTASEVAVCAQLPCNYVVIFCLLCMLNPRYTVNINFPLFLACKEAVPQSVAFPAYVYCDNVLKF